MAILHKKVFHALVLLFNIYIHGMEEKDITDKQCQEPQHKDRIIEVTYRVAPSPIHASNKLCYTRIIANGNTINSNESAWVTVVDNTLYIVPQLSPVAQRNFTPKKLIVPNNHDKIVINQLTQKKSRTPFGTIFDFEDPTIDTEYEKIAARFISFTITNNVQESNIYLMFNGCYIPPKGKQTITCPNGIVSIDCLEYRLKNKKVPTGLPQYSSDLLQLYDSRVSVVEQKNNYYNQIDSDIRYHLIPKQRAVLKIPSIKIDCYNPSNNVNEKTSKRLENTYFNTIPIEVLSKILRYHCYHDNGHRATLIKNSDNTFEFTKIEFHSPFGEQVQKWKKKVWNEELEKWEDIWIEKTTEK